MAAREIVALEMRTERLRRKADDYNQKQALIKEYQDNYGVEISLEEKKKYFKELDHVSVEMVLKKKLRKKIERDAAI